MIRARAARQRRGGFVILAVLVVVVVLSLAAYQYGELMTAEYRAASQVTRAAEVKVFADSGIHYAAAALANKDTLSGTLGGNPFDNPGSFRGVIVAPNDLPYRQGRFTIVAGPDPDEGGSSSAFRYGVVDEASKINLNALLQIDSSGQAALTLLMKLPNMTEEIANAILDWLDPDDTPRTNGAENEAYSALDKSYRCKNGPLDSLEELLLVRDMTPQLLFGTDRNRNGVLDAGEDDGNGFDPGWLPYLTIYSREANTDADGNARVYINDADMVSLKTKLETPLGADLAAYLLAYRIYGGTTERPTASNTLRYGTPTDLTNKLQETLAQPLPSQPRSISSVFELIGTYVVIDDPPPPPGQPQTQTAFACPINDTAQQREGLPKLLDKCTTQQTSELPGRVNVITAPQAVLACLPGLTEAEVQAIVERRPYGADLDVTDPTYQTTAWLMTDCNIRKDTMRTLDRYVTSRAQVFRVQSLGYLDQGGPVARVEAVIDTNNGRPRIVAYRDLSELGRGFDVTGGQ